MSEERQQNFTVAESYELPSKGKIYDVKVNPMVELRSMTARDEMKRLNPSSTPLKSLADIIEGCCIEKPAIHVYDMCIGDFDYLLHQLRIVTYGPEFKVTVQCQECGEYVDTTADLETLTLKEFNEAEFEALRTFSLPKSGKTITLKFFTPRIMDEIEAKTREMKRKHKTADIDFSTYAKLTTCIDLVDGNKLGIIDLENTINTLPAADMMKILNNLEKLNQCIGLDNELIVTCPKCGSDVRTFFRYGPEFFRPSNL